ncbi:MAG: T9SS type A sorting domain-containing protein, partial [Flavobacterium sp.]
ADGKILIAGYSRNSTYQNYINIVRYSNNGTLDATFDGDGKVIAELDSTNDECNILLLQPDNKLLAIGTKRNATENGYLFKDIALARYNGDGSLDASFGADGKVVSVFAPNDMNKVHQAVLQPDGKIVISNTYYNIYTGNSILHHELIRYTPNGVIDMAFGTSGRVIIDAEPVTMLSQPDGKIIVITLSYDSQSNAFVTLKRYNTNGLIDTSFGNNGTTGFAGIFWGPLTAALHPTGKIIIAESSPNTNGVSTFALTCFNPDGTIDSTFENDPMPGDTGRYSYGIFVEPDGKIIVAGRSTSVSDGGSTFFEFITARYNPDGSIDATYGTGGVVTSYLGSTYEPYNIIRSIVYQPDGKFLVALTKEEQNPASPNPNSYDFVIYRFNADGGYDSEFGTNGQVITSFYNKYDEAFAMVVQPDNKIVVAGTTDTGINRDFSLVRFKNSIALGSSKFEAGAGLILYPNPVKDILHLQATDATGIIDYSIYNMLGKLLDKSTGDSLKVDVSDFSSGIYNVHINTNKGTLSKKFVKE